MKMPLLPSLKSLVPLAAVLSSVILWGISFLSIKFVVQEIPPASMAWFRQIPALITLLLLMRQRQENFKIEKGEWLTFIAAALFGIVFYSVFENSGLQWTSPATASMLVAAIPVFILVLESAMTRKRPDLTTALCIVLSIGGVWLVLFDGGLPDLSSGSFKGNLLVLGAMACWIIYTFISKKLGQRYSSLKLTTIQTLWALLLYFPFSVGEMPRWHIPSIAATFHLTFLGVFCSAIAYVLYLYGVNVLGSVIPSTFLNLCPVVTILAGFLAFGEIPSWVQLAGALLIVGSLTALSLIKIVSVRKSQSQPVYAEAAEEQARMFMEV